MNDAVLRHMVFLEEEAAAASPCERLRVFAAYTLREVQIRRRRCAEWGLEVDVGKRDGVWDWGDGGIVKGAGGGS